MRLTTTLDSTDLERIGDELDIAPEIARQVPRRDGRAQIDFTLKLTGERWRRRSHQGRRIAAVCWHGHYAFMAAIFAADPDAELRTGIPDPDAGRTPAGAMRTMIYRGAAGFAAKAPGTADRNIGSEFEPMTYGDACDCNGTLDGNTHALRGLADRVVLSLPVEVRS